MTRYLLVTAMLLFFGSLAHAQNTLPPVTIGGTCTGCGAIDPGGSGGAPPGGGRCSENTDVSSSEGCEPPPPPPPKACIDAEQPGNRVDFSKIARQEEDRTAPYVPGNGSFSSSGVSIGVGVDLRFWMASELRGWGVSTATINRLSPALATAPGAFGPGGASAVAVAASISAGNWQIPDSDRDAMSLGAFNRTVSLLAHYFNPDQSVGVSFNQLPEEVQQTLVDAAYPFGPNHFGQGGAQGATLWTQLATGDYQGAANTLAGWNGPHAGRMGMLANQLNAAIASGKLPPKATAGRC